MEDPLCLNMLLHPLETLIHICMLDPHKTLTHSSQTSTLQQFAGCLMHKHLALSSRMFSQRRPHIIVQRTHSRVEEGTATNLKTTKAISILK